MAGVTGLEPAASCVTGRRSNQLSYTPEADAHFCARKKLMMDFRMKVKILN